ncbi:MAG: hypothetical protein H6707_12160 [Deltaproteobacteria bacterium]|nr:hypothetical protein [Deltaproteobacteria bacterium]
MLGLYCSAKCQRRSALLLLLPCALSCATTESGGAANAGLSGTQQTTESGKLEQIREQRSGAMMLRITPPRRRSPGGQPDLLAGVKLHQEAEQGGSILLGFRSTSQRWQFSGCRRLALHAGPQLLLNGDAWRDTQIGHGQLNEFIYTLIDTGQARQLLAGADHLRVSLCEQTPFSLRPEETSNLRAFLQRATGSSSP